MNRFSLGLVLSAVIHGLVIVYAGSTNRDEPKFNVQTGRSSVEVVFASAARASGSPEAKQEKSKNENEEKTGEVKKKAQKRNSRNPEQSRKTMPVEKGADSSESDTADKSKRTRTSSSENKTKKTERKKSKQSAPQAVKHAGVKWVRNADYRRNPPPRYPTRARVRHQDGVVKLLVKINARGIPENVRVRESSGYHRLDRAARNAVRRWEFVPAEKNGKKVASMTVVPVRFSLDR